LNDYIRKRLKEMSLSAAAISKNARRAGVRLPSSTLSTLARSDYANPSVETIKALAAGLGAPLEELIAEAFDIDLDFRQVGEVDSQLTRIILKYRALSADERHEIAGIMKGVELVLDDRLARKGNKGKKAG